MSLIGNILRTAATSVLALCASFGTAQATVVSGNFNASGYSTFNFSVAAPATVDIAYTGGYGDPTFSLFNASGAHLVTNDDSNGSVYSHLTQTLGSGSYSLLVSYCCQSATYAGNNGAVYSNTDGVNYGSYWFGGTGTLAGMEAYLDQPGFDTYAANSAYALTISNVALGGTVPEPGSLALVGLALFGLNRVTRRRPV